MRVERGTDRGDADQGQQGGDAEGTAFGFEQLADAGHEMASVRGERVVGVGEGRRRGCEPVEFGQGDGEPARLAGDAGSEIIRDEFAFDADAP